MANSTLSHQLEAIYHRESRRVFATLVRLLGDMDLAEDAMQEAFNAAFQQWPEQGIPQNPRAWLVSTGRFKAIDHIRREQRLDKAREDLLHQLDHTAEITEDEQIEDDRLRLMFTCCHPAIAPPIQIALTLREICGLTTEAIASAFLVTPSTMAQRIVRGKAKIKTAGIPYHVPQKNELTERLDSVLSVIYLVFNEGYHSTQGNALTHPDFCQEAIRLGRLLLSLLPDAEVQGLLALMLIQEARRPARIDQHGDIILLEDQNRALWHQDYIQEAQQLLQDAYASQSIGSYCLEASIAAVHAEAMDFESTNWSRLIALYSLLQQSSPSPIIELNRAVAIAMQPSGNGGLSRENIQQGLDQINKLIQGPLNDYYLAHAAKADLHRRLKDVPSALATYQYALGLASQPADQRFLQKRIAQLQPQKKI